jgi:phosphatidylglycerophosphate synthase
MTLKQQGQLFVYKSINPIIKLLIKLGVTPNMITLAGLILNFLATIILIIGAEKGDRTDHSYLGWAGLVILIAGLFDMIDGRLARVGNMANPFGALFDSVIDRYSEMIMFLGIIWYLVSHDYFLSSVFGFVAMIGSVMVSYTRARAEGLGVECSVGLMQRPERILIIGISAILCGLFSVNFSGGFKYTVDWLPIPLFETVTLFTLPLSILAIMANVTAIRRLNYSKKVLMARNQN